MKNLHGYVKTLPKEMQYLRDKVQFNRNGYFWCFIPPNQLLEIIDQNVCWMKTQMFGFVSQFCDKADVCGQVMLFHTYLNSP